MGTDDRTVASGRKIARQDRHLLEAAFQREGLNMPGPLIIGSAIDAAGRGWDCATMILTLDAKRRLSIAVILAPTKPGDEFDA
jgi:hypothetical protein